MKLRDRYACCKKALALTNKSGTSSKAVKNARVKLKNFAFLAWLDDFIKPRKSKNNIDEPKKKKETEKPLPNVSVSNSEDEGVDEDDTAAIFENDFKKNSLATYCLHMNE